MTLAERVDAVLDCTKMNNEGIVLKEIHERMREIMLELKNNLTAESAATAMEKTKQETKNKLELVNHSE